MTKILAFDVSETLQTGSEYNDGGLGQPMIDEEGYVIPNAYSVLVGGKATADLLIEAQNKGITIVLVTNNGADLDTGVINRTLAFLANYGVIIPAQNYLGPLKDTDGSKVRRLEDTVIRNNITKDDLVFFDDSRSNVEEAQAKGFRAIRVKSPTDLQDGIRAVLQSQVKNDEVPDLIDNFNKDLENNNPTFIKPAVVTPELTEIDKILTVLRNKIEKVEQHIYPRAHKKAIELLGSLECARNQYAAGLENFSHDKAVLKQNFIDHCKLAIDDAHQVLDRDLHWGDYLVNLFKSLGNAFIGIFSQNKTFFTLARPTSSEAVDEANRNLLDLV